MEQRINTIIRTYVRWLNSSSGRMPFKMTSGHFYALSKGTCLTIWYRNQIVGRYGLVK